MLTTLSALIAPFAVKIVASIAALVGIAVAYFGAKRQGRIEERNRASLEAEKHANDIRKAGADARAGVDPAKLRENDGWRRD